jgi:hypothetical protein
MYIFLRKLGPEEWLYSSRNSPELNVRSHPVFLKGRLRLGSWNFKLSFKVGAKYNFAPNDR